jgi:hypothetical protein
MLRGSGTGSASFLVVGGSNGTARCELLYTGQPMDMPRGSLPLIVDCRTSFFLWIRLVHPYKTFNPVAYHPGVLTLFGFPVLLSVS